jgi:hypothetical protein
MSADLQTTQAVLNRLFERPIADLTTLFHKEQNGVLLRKHDLELT